MTSIHVLSAPATRRLAATIALTIAAALAFSASAPPQPSSVRLGATGALGDTAGGAVTRLLGAERFVTPAAAGADTRSPGVAPDGAATARDGAVLAGTSTGWSTTPGTALAARPDARIMLQSVPWQNLRQNTHGICDGAFTHVIKNVSAGSDLQAPLNYLNIAQGCGLKVVFHFSATVSGGTVYPSRVARWVNAVKSHPSLDGYLTVKEPSWQGINATEIRSLYSAFKAADPAHTVYALFGDIPAFGATRNPYTAGMADVVIVDWYPYETGYGGCSSSGSSYVATGPTNYARVKTVIASRTPGTPLVGMLQTHKNLAPTCHKKQLPTKSILWRMAREALVNGAASGLAFHTWTNTTYQMDQLRNPTMVGWMKTLSGQVRAGTFQ